MTSSCDGRYSQNTLLKLEWTIIFSPNLQAGPDSISQIKLLSKVQPKTSINLQGFANFSFRLFVLKQFQEIAGKVWTMPNGLVSGKSEA